MYIKMSERNAGKKRMIMTILNSMSYADCKEVLNSIYGMYADTDSIKVIKSVDSADLMAIKNEFEQIHADNEAIEVEVARIEDETDERINKLNKHFEELLARINIVDNATGKTFNKVNKKFDMIHDDIEAFVHEYDEMKSKINEWYENYYVHTHKAIEIDSARIDAQAETIEKLCKIIKFILPRVNANPFGKEYEEIKKTLEDIYKEF